MIDYKPMVEAKLAELFATTEMTSVEILYSILRSTALPNKPDDVRTGWILNIDERDLFTAIDRIVTEEKLNKDE